MRRVCALSLLIAFALAVAGCGASPVGSGRPTAAVYVSLPLHGPQAALGRSARVAASRALRAAGGRFGEVGLYVRYLDGGGPGGWGMAATAANARRAAEDSRTVAYIGELDPAATRFSRGLTARAGITQVAAGHEVNTAVGARSFGRGAMKAVLQALRDAAGADDLRQATGDALRSERRRGGSGLAVDAP